MLDRGGGDSPSRYDPVHCRNRARVGRTLAAHARHPRLPKDNVRASTIMTYSALLTLT